MTTHELKCWPAEFDALERGDKVHEFRLNDREFRFGDRLVLRRWDPATQEYTGKWVRRSITYVGTGFGIPDGYCVLSLQLDDQDIGERIRWAALNDVTVHQALSIRSLPYVARLEIVVDVFARKQKLLDAALVDAAARIPPFWSMGPEQKLTPVVDAHTATAQLAKSWGDENAQLRELIRDIRAENPTQRWSYTTQSRINEVLAGSVKR